MIEIKATTNAENGSTGCEINVNANGLEYMAEIISIVESLMKGLKENDAFLHATVIKIFAEHPHILLGEDEESDKAKEFERLVATAKFKEGVN